MTSPDNKSNHGLDPTAGPTSRDLHDIIHEALNRRPTLRARARDWLRRTRRRKH